MKNTTPSTSVPRAPYQAPRIESVLRREALEREVLYAGAIPVSGTTALA